MIAMNPEISRQHELCGLTHPCRIQYLQLLRNGDITKRAQGVCLSGWNIRGDCEWMYLEHGQGMSYAHQKVIEVRTSGNVSAKLKAGGSSGFDALLTGSRDITHGIFWLFGTEGHYWTSSETSTTRATMRSLFLTNASVNRTAGYANYPTKCYSYSVRCLKD